MSFKNEGNIKEIVDKMWNPPTIEEVQKTLHKDKIKKINLSKAKDFLLEANYYLSAKPIPLNNLNEDFKQISKTNYSKSVDCLFDETNGIIPLKLLNNQKQKFLPKFVFNQIWMDWYIKNPKKAVKKLHKIIYKIDEKVKDM